MEHDPPELGDPTDAACMREALALAGTARTRTAPNPWVGCVVVRDGTVVGRGATQPPGGPHAEAEALVAAGDAARGATAYVTLEPCSHEGRTQPCADALAAAGIRRVVAAVEDTDSRVAGRGFARLRELGVAVDVGVEAEAARRLLAPYLHHRRTGRASCMAKLATSVDGRAAAPDGSSRWITGPAARADAHRLRGESQAVVVGAGTALTDLPELTVRDAPLDGAPPLRVLLDARGRVPAVGPLFDVDLAPTLVVTTSAASPDAEAAWRKAGAEVEVVAPGAGGVDLVATLALLGSRGVLQAMVEGGPTLHGALLGAGLVDRLVVYVGPVVLGAAAISAWEVAGPATIAAAGRWRLLGAQALGDDVRLDYEPASIMGEAA